jgi:hypothetical protein
MSERDLVDRIEQLERRLRELEARENATFNASNILAGTLSTDRYSAYADLVAEGKLTMTVGGIVLSDQLRRPFWWTIVNDFTTNSPPSGWQWAGAPFVPPPQTQLIGGTIYAATGYTSHSRSFLYTPVGPIYDWLVIRPHTLGVSVGACGVRMDNGSDNNYVEVVITVPYATRIPEVHLRWRVGGGAINDVVCNNMSGWWLMGWGVVLGMELQGSRWSSWRGRPRVMSPYGTAYDLLSDNTTLTWTPTRLGFVVQSGASPWEQFGVDWTNF